ISRSNEVEKIFKNSGIEVKLRTQIKKEDDAQVIILDTIGELGQLYSIADIVFIGGSLVPAGGHNLLEAAAYGKPIAVGPYMFNFKEIHELFSKEKACKTVKDENQLIETFNEFFENEGKFKEMGNIAMKIINENRGSAKRDVDIFGKTFTQNC
ncbi:MAG: glycosyltransferase, partial [Dialister micraerophilus]|nr:glycosyltransferase [Dialister micraerophilus]